MSKELYLSYCIELSAGKFPRKIKLLPHGEMTGNDGRHFVNNNPEDIVAAFNADPREVALDIEHSTEIQAPQGKPAPAQGWFTEFEVIDGEVWAMLDLNKNGLELIDGKNYKYISPAFYHDEHGNIFKVSSVGLTNKPNLNLPSLNREKENAMLLPLAVATALALNADASEQDALSAISKLQTDNKQLALNAQQPDLEKFVPKATHDLALNRASEAESTLQTIADTNIKATVDDAIKAGKIAPANKDMMVSLCQQQGVEKFQSFIDDSPKIVNTKPEPSKDKAQGKTLTEAELAMCHQMNLSEKDFLAAKEE